MIKIGNKDIKLDYQFRETCFGICYREDNLYLTKKKGETYLVGGGIEVGENHTQCLKREFLEEIGCHVIKTSKLCTIDCFWMTRDHHPMESLTHIYVVKISDETQTPLEKDSKLVKLTMEEANRVLELPYQKKALDVFSERCITV